VLVTPAETFYITPGLGKTQVRLAFVLKKEKLEKAISHLITGLKEFKH
jgi:aspartate aminotransferase